MKEKWAIVTGASKGLGFYYCNELIKRNYNIIAIARNLNNDLINKLIKNKPNNLQIKLLNYDLINFENIKKIYEFSKNYNVDLLINNAGFGVWGLFEKTDLAKEMNMIDLNIKALHILTKMFLKRFKENNQGRIINIASMAGFVPGPVFSSYYASKAYVLNLGIAINTELKKQKENIRLVTICPGPLATDFWKNASNQIANQLVKYKTKIKAIDVNVYAKKSLKKALKTKNKNYIIVGKINKIIKFMQNKIPNKIVLNEIYKYQKERNN